VEAWERVNEASIIRYRFVSFIYNLLFVSNDVMINTPEPAKFSTQGDRERPRGEEAPCEVRVLAWYGCAAPVNASVADVYYEYSSGGLDRTTALKLLVT